jgi:outer membrane protein insertion porin family
MRCVGTVPKETTTIMRHRSLHALFFMILLSVSAASQPKISAIRFQGNHYFSQRELLDGFPLSLKAEASVQRLNASRAALMDRYRSEGFFLARIDPVQQLFSADSLSVELVYSLDEGTQSAVGQFRITGATVSTPSEIHRSFETTPGLPLRQAVLEKDIDELLTRYENCGYPLANARVDSLAIDSLDAGYLSFVLSITEGPRVSLKEISVDGNTATRSEVVAREAYLQADEIYRQEKVDRFRRRLERLGIFSSVGEPQLFLARNPDSAGSVAGGLSIAVQEGNTNNFDGIVGYVPSTTTDGGGYFTGNVFVSMRNLFGTGRKAVVRWQRENQSTQELEASYNEPWIAGYPLNAGISIFQRKQDSTYIKDRLDVRADVSLSTELSLGVSINQESVFPSAELTHFTVFESSILSFGGEIRYDTRDNLRSPKMGVNYATAYNRGTKKISGPGAYLSSAPERKFLVERFSVDMEYYLSLFSKQVLLSGFHGKKITSSHLEQSDLYQIGGTNTVRGYRENQFYGSQIVWSNVENRFLTGRYSSVFVFVDAGYFSRPPDELRGISSREKFLYGYGIGARIETALGILRISYALGEGDGFSTGKIHFGIANEF